MWRMWRWKLWLWQLCLWRRFKWRKFKFSSVTLVLDKRFPVSGEATVADVERGVGRGRGLQWSK